MTTIRYFPELRELVGEGAYRAVEYHTYEEVAAELAIREGLPVYYEHALAALIERRVHHGAAEYEYYTLHELLAM